MSASFTVALVQAPLAWHDPQRNRAGGLPSLKPQRSSLR